MCAGHPSFQMMASYLCVYHKVKSEVRPSAITKFRQSGLTAPEAYIIDQPRFTKPHSQADHSPLRPQHGNRL